MPNQPKTPLKRLRVANDLWERFGEVADPDRSEVLRAFMRWYVRERGATLPARPSPEPTRRAR